MLFRTALIFGVVLRARLDVSLPTLHRLLRLLLYFSLFIIIIFWLFNDLRNFLIFFLFFFGNILLGQVSVSHWKLADKWL